MYICAAFHPQMMDMRRREIGLVLVLLLAVPNIPNVQCHTSEDPDTHKNRYDWVIDDLTWLTFLIIVVSLVSIAVCFCADDDANRSAYRPPAQCNDCCRKHTIHMYIEPQDIVKNNNNDRRLTRQGSYGADLPRRTSDVENGGPVPA